MPCNDGGPSYDPAPALKKRLNKATRLLCELCAKLESAQQLEKFATPGVLTWWRRHKRADERRREAERAEREKKSLRKRALAKAKAALSPEERAAINLDDD
jgi:hypothetical protein